MAELKPCHFETGKRLPGIVKRPDFPHGYKYQVVWESEDQEIIICTRLFEKKQQAIEAWNKRSQYDKTYKRAD